MLSDELVTELQQSVKQVIDPGDTLGEGNSFTHTSFIEHSPAMWKLFDHEPFMRAQRVFCQTEELTVNRTAAIIRNPGSDPLSWHSDFCGFSNGPPTSSGDILNRGPWPSGLWFYITGTSMVGSPLSKIPTSKIGKGPKGSS